MMILLKIFRDWKFPFLRKQFPFFNRSRTCPTRANDDLLESLNVGLFSEGPYAQGTNSFNFNLLIQ